MKLIIDISDKMFDIFKKNGIMAFDNLDEYSRDMIAVAIANGTPYEARPQGEGDSISRIFDVVAWKPNCVTCDHFGKCEGCEKRDEE